MNDKQKLAAKIAAQLRELATIVERAGNGEEMAQKLLVGHIDGYWHGLVVGQNEVQELTTNEE